MNRADLVDLMTRVASGHIAPSAAANTLAGLPVPLADGAAAQLDVERAGRTGVPEVILGDSKSAQQVAALLVTLAEATGSALATRVDAAKAASICQAVPAAQYHALARTVRLGPAVTRDGRVVVVSAGTSDAAVAAEAVATLAYLGITAAEIADVGVAGIHRLLARADELRTADVVIAIAGMEGALPTAVSGLVRAPVIAVPTSVGYGVGLGGLVALASMLGTCAPGVTVVNIDNGFGAAVSAFKILLLRGAHEEAVR